MIKKQILLLFIAIILIITTTVLIILSLQQSKEETQDQVEDVQIQETEIVNEIIRTDYSYKIVDTGVTKYYSNNSVITQPTTEDDFYGQDAHYQGNKPSYTNNGNGTITDDVTGLMWQKDMGGKITSTEAILKANNLILSGYNDWRIPTIKELYSLIQFTGQSSINNTGTLYIDETYFIQPIGDKSIGEREIDAQVWSSTEYVGYTMNGDKTIFGVNFIDGRIKGYGIQDPRTRVNKEMYYRMVRGNTEYGINEFKDNNDGTISDLNTGLMWQQEDNGIGLDWKNALSYSNSLELASYDDWRLPNAKELQSIVDYSRSPQTSNSAAIDPIFEISSIIDPNGKIDYPFFWTSTTHLDGINPESGAVYICFGECQGEMNNTVLDVHGAGAQRSDPKSGDISKYPQYFGPQGDIRYVYNYVRAVRDMD